MRIITNNPLVKQHYEDSSFTVEYSDVSYRQVLVLARDAIHSGAIINTHPLSGSVKPNETPYKSLALSKRKGAVDHESLRIIELSIETCDKFGPCRFELTERLRQDFMLIDHSLITGAIPRR